MARNNQEYDGVYDKDLHINILKALQHFVLQKIKADLEEKS